MTPTAPAKDRIGYACSECGYRTAKWVGRCPECQTWGSVTESRPKAGPRTRAVAPAQRARPIDQVDGTESAAKPTSMGELDRVLGGGLVPGSVVLLAGEPGVGKSTLLLEVAARRARSGGENVLYVSAEESAAQVRLRAERIGALAPTLLLAAENDLATVLGLLEEERPVLAVIDSAQTVVTSEVEGAAGSVSQVREVASALIAAAKRMAIPVVLVGHVTKDGSVAGPRTLEHLVDVVCQFEGERHTRLRMLRALKNRYGPTDEVGCFEMNGDGIDELPDPSAAFVSRSACDTPGRALAIALEGRRPMAVEIQALLADTQASNPRRTTSGTDSSRLALILAVLQRRLGVPVQSKEVYVSTVGGVRVAEPASDLAVALACASCAADRPLPAGVIAVGEIGLTGEVRPVAGLSRRLGEAARMGFTRAIVPRGNAEESYPSSMTVVEVDLLSDAVSFALGQRVAQSRTN